LKDEGSSQQNHNLQEVEVQEEKRIDEGNRSITNLRFNSETGHKENPVFLTRLAFGLLVTDIVFVYYL